MKLTIVAADLIRALSRPLADELLRIVTRINTWANVNHRPDGTHLFAWTDIPYDAAIFTANNAMTWAVDRTDVLQLRWRRIDTTVSLRIVLSGTTVGGVVSTLLLLQMPAELTAPDLSFSVLGQALDAGVSTAITIAILAGTAQLRIGRLDGAAFTAGTTAIRISMDYEVA